MRLQTTEAAIQNPSRVDASHNASEKSEIVWIHSMRAFAVFAVILIHVSGYILMNLPFDSYGWWVAHLFNSMVRIAVPLFFMITGVLLLAKEESAVHFYGKRFGKVLIPFLIWTVFYALWMWWFADEKALSDYDWSNLSSHLMVPSYYHMWFMYVLVVFYLILPILRLLTDFSNTERVWQIVAVWWIVGYFGFSAYQWIIIDLLTEEQISLVSPIISYTQLYIQFIGYLYLGLALSRVPLTATHFKWAVIIAIVNLSLIIIGTYWLTAQQDGRLHEYFYDTSPGLVLYSGAIFVIIRYLSENQFSAWLTKHINTLVRLSAASFGTYFLHPLILDFFLLAMRVQDSGSELILHYPVLSNLILPIVTMVICTFVLSIVYRIPEVKRIIG